MKSDITPLEQNTRGKLADGLGDKVSKVLAKQKGDEDTFEFQAASKKADEHVHELIKEKDELKTVSVEDSKVSGSLAQTSRSNVTKSKQNTKRRSKSSGSSDSDEEKGITKVKKAKYEVNEFIKMN